MGPKELADRLLAFAVEVGREQKRHDDVGQLWRECIATGGADTATRATELLKGCKAIRQGFAAHLRAAGTEAPQSIGASLYKLAKRLETSADDVSDELCELARELQAVEAEPQGEVAVAKKKTTRRRRKNDTTPKPLTAKQLEAIQIVGECKGNIADAAKRVGIDRKSMKERYMAGMAKLGKQAVKHGTEQIRNDKRGQSNIVDGDDTRG